MHVANVNLLFVMLLLLLLLLLYNRPVHGVTIGGVSAFTQKHFELVNGFTNECHGWGGEDDDMSFRWVRATVTVAYSTGM